MTLIYENAQSHIFCNRKNGVKYVNFLHQISKEKPQPLANVLRLRFVNLVITLELACTLSIFFS